MMRRMQKLVTQKTRQTRREDPEKIGREEDHGWDNRSEKDKLERAYNAREWGWWMRSWNRKMQSKRGPGKKCIDIIDNLLDTERGDLKRRTGDQQEWSLAVGTCRGAEQWRTMMHFIRKIFMNNESSFSNPWCQELWGIYRDSIDNRLPSLKIFGHQM